MKNNNIEMMEEAIRLTDGGDYPIIILIYNYTISDDSATTIQHIYKVEARKYCIRDGGISFNIENDFETRKAVFVFMTA